MRQQKDGDGSLPIINASEIGRYAFCARAWWLHRALGYTPRNLAALERGVRGHENHGRRVLAAQRQMAIVRWLLLAALATAILLVLLLLRT
jgi:hypothetical protein